MTLQGLDAAARNYLAYHPKMDMLTEAHDMGKDAKWGPWVFKCRKDNVPFENPEGRGWGAVCFTIFDTWGTSSYHSSKFPNLLMSIYADRDRDENGSPVGDSLSAKDRALRIYEAVHPLFDDVFNQIHSFDYTVNFETFKFPIISTLAGGGFYIDDVVDGDGVVRLDQIYNIQTY